MSPSIWKICTANFAFVLAVAHVVAEIPSYIHVCGRQDQNLQECILNSVENLNPKLCQGIPELEVKPLEPLVINKLSLIDTTDAKMMMENITITGLCDPKINFFHMDLDKQFYFNFTFTRIMLNGTLSINARILVPIALKETIFITTDNTSALVTIHMKVVTKGGVRYLYFPQMTLNLDIKGYDIEFPVNNDEMKQFREIARHFLGNSRKEIIATIKPAFEETISQYILDASNNIVKHFTYDELFPDRT